MESIELIVSPLDLLDRATIKTLSRLVLEPNSALETFLYRWRSRSDNRGSHVVYALLEEQIVGWAKVQTGSTRSEGAFFVSPSFRRKGIGMELWRTAASVSEEYGVPLHVTEWNQSSHLFFKACGALHVHTLEGYQWKSDSVLLEEAIA